MCFRSSLFLFKRLCGLGPYLSELLLQSEPWRVLRSSSVDLWQSLGTHQEQNPNPSLLELTVITVLISYFSLPLPLLPLGVSPSTLGAGLGLPAGLEVSLCPGRGGCPLWLWQTRPPGVHTQFLSAQPVSVCSWGRSVGGWVSGWGRLFEPLSCTAWIKVKVQSCSVLSQLRLPGWGVLLCGWTDWPWSPTGMWWIEGELNLTYFPGWMAQV